MLDLFCFTQEEEMLVPGAFEVLHHRSYAEIGQPAYCIVLERSEKVSAISSSFSLLVPST